MKKTHLVIALLITVIFVTTGCEKIKLLDTDKPKKAEMTKVEVTFEKGNSLSGYIESLDIGKVSTVYTGGVTTTNLYDEKGNIIAVFNYNKVQYIKVVK
ncbi:MAG: hypothetical protein ACM3PP_04875 [Candidatus Saccharibacteria bacterium]